LYEIERLKYYLFDSNQLKLFHCSQPPKITEDEAGLSEYQLQLLRYKERMKSEEFIKVMGLIESKYDEVTKKMLENLYIPDKILSERGTT
jgi:hypothetical protein